MKYQYCFVQQKVVPQNEVIQGRYAQQGVKASDLFTTDEMPPTKSPITGKYYTSKSQLRAEYKSRVYVEIGNEYDNGYTPERETERGMKQLFKNMKQNFKERLNE